jgi:hypothetical protein
MFWKYGDEFGKTERGFIQIGSYTKTSPIFTQTSHIGRNEDFTGPYFSEIQEAESQRTDGKEIVFKGTDHP